MYLLKSIIRKSQMKFDFDAPKHEEQRTVHASTRHLQNGAVVQVAEHQRRTEVEGQKFTTYKEAMAHVDRQRRRIKGYLGSDEYRALYPHIKELEQREKDQAKQQEVEWRRAGKYPDGRLVPKVGDEVFIVTVGMFGTSASIQGEVYHAKNGNYRVKVTATHAIMGGEAGAKDYPLTPEWTVRNDPELTRREEARKQNEQARIAQADREHQEWLQKQTDEYRAALARGEQPVKPEDVREGDVLNYYDGLGNPRKVEVRGVEEYNGSHYISVSNPGPLTEDGYWPGGEMTLNSPDFDGGERPRVTRTNLHKSKPLTHLLRKSHIPQELVVNHGGTAFSRQAHEDKRQRQMFLRTRQGSTHFGEISPSVAAEAGISAGKIMLMQGNHVGDHNGYGKEHIAAEHENQIKDAGYESIEDFVQYVGENYNAIYKAKKGRVALVVEGPPQRLAVVELRKNKMGGYYSVTTAYPPKNQKFSGTPLWRGRHPSQSASDAQPPLSLPKDGQCAVVTKSLSHTASTSGQNGVTNNKIPSQNDPRKSIRHLPMLVKSRPPVTCNF